MNSKYSIKDLEQLSGIKAHTIRIWEQRYGIIEPRRTETNIRYYEDCDLRKILNVSFLVHNGLKISKVSQLKESEMIDLVQEKSAHTGDYLQEINALKMAMFEYNQDGFDKAFDDCVNKYGLEKTFTDVVGRFIAELGMLWQTNTVSVTNEHFVSNLIKQKLYSAIDAMKQEPKRGAKTYLLYLPAGELHEIGLLYLQYLLKNKGERVVFLGQDTPCDYLTDVHQKNPIDYAVSVFTTKPHCGEVETYFDDLLEKMKNTPVIFMFCGVQLTKTIESGYSNKRLKLFKNVTELSQALV